MHIMIDLETFDTEPSAVVWEIGAVAFDPASGAQITHGDTFHWLIDPAAQSNRTTSKKTLEWWSAQPTEAYMRIRDAEAEGIDLDAVLLDLESWISKLILEHCESASKLQVWANSPSFDLAILKNAYQQLGRDTPWRYHQERDYRTLKTLMPHIKMQRTGTHHSALDDAISQAQHTTQLLAAIGKA